MKNPFDGLKVEALIAFQRHFAGDFDTLKLIRLAATNHRSVLLERQFALESRLHGVQAQLDACASVLDADSDGFTL